jgi:hypothetical protein
MANNSLLADPTEEELQAVAQQSLLADPSIAEKASVAPESTTADQIETALRSTAEGLTIGVSEPVVSGGIAVKNQIKQAIESGSLDPLALENFLKQYQQDVEQRQIQKEQNPGLDIGGQVVGAVAPIIMTGGAALGLRGAAAAARGASALDLGSNIAVRAGKLATSPLSKAAQPLAEAAQLAGATKATKAGAAITKLGVSAAEHATGAVAQEAARQGVLKSTGFMKPGDGPDLDDVAVVGAALPVVGKGVGALTKGAKVAGKGAMKVFLGASEEKIDNYLKNYDVLQNARDLKEIENAARSNLAFLKQNAPKAEDALATDVLDHLDILGKRISDASSEAFDLLDRSGRTFDVNELNNAIESVKSKLLTGGKTLVGAANKGAYAKLESIQGDLRSLSDAVGGEIPASSVKEVIQALDQEYNELARGEFAATAGTVVNQARAGINNILKDVDGYAAKMKEVSSLVDLRKRVFQEFGGSDKKALAGVKAALNGNLPRERLLNEFAQAQPIALAQAQEAKKFAEQVNLLNDSNIGDKLSLFVKGSNDPKLRDQLSKLADLSDEGMLKELEALRANEAFNKGFIQGSRNVNMWTVIGASAKQALLGGKALAGAAAGMTISPGLAAVGAAWGATVDLYGPQMARSILKGMMEIKGIPTVAKIRALDIPEDTKRLMIQDLARAMRPTTIKDKNQEKELNAFYAPEASRPIIASEIRRASDLSPEQKAEMIQSLNKTGRVVDFDKVVFAAEDKKPKQPSLVKTKDTKPAMPSDAVQEYFDYKKRQSY